MVDVVKAKMDTIQSTAVSEDIDEFGREVFIINDIEMDVGLVMSTYLMITMFINNLFYVHLQSIALDLNTHKLK